jgi:hypothetical protein
VKPWEKLQRYWAETDSGVVTGPKTEAQIAALEARYDIVLPEDFREYLLNSCPGERAWCFDDASTDWWPLGRIKVVEEELEGPKIKEANRPYWRYLFFADGYIWCWAWAICCDRGDADYGRIRVFGREPDRFVAESFAEFVDLHVTEPSELF